jgi:glycosyltransferase involved in cell wall biosynthesis
MGRRGRWQSMDIRVTNPPPDVEDKAHTSSVLPHDTKNTVYFDISDLFEYALGNDRLSGIQRVTVRLSAQIMAAHGRERFKFMAYHPRHEQLYEVDSSWCTEDFDFSRRDFSRKFRLSSQTIGSYLSRYRNRPGRYLWHLGRVGFFALIGRRSFFEKRQIDLPFTRSKQASQLSDLRPLRPAPGDTLVILGATWGLSDLKDYVTRAHASGVHVMLFVHDLIPLVTPQFVVDNVPEVFEEWLRGYKDIVDRFLVNSNCTGRDLRTKLVEMDPEARPDIVTVPLAHEFLRARPKTGRKEPIRAHVRAAAHLPYVLVVGTIEARKNVWSMARVWQRMVAELGGKCPRLIFAGKQGWLKEDYDQLMRATGNVGGYVRVLDNPTDNELEFLYRNCLFTAYPSYYEGWGLPIGESLWFGKACLTSSASSMPEVGGDLCVYADPYDVDDIYAKCLDLIEDVPARKRLEDRIECATLRTWSDVGSDLYAAIAEPLADAP